MFLIKILLGSFLLIEIDAFLDLEENSELTDYEICFHQIKEHLPEYDFNLIIKPTKTEFEDNLRMRVIWNNYTQPLKTFEYIKPNFYLIILGDTYTFADLLKYVTLSPMWNPNAIFVIISEENVEEIFENLLKRYILKVLILRREKENDSIDIWTNPYEPSLINRCEGDRLKTNEFIVDTSLEVDHTLRVALVPYPPYVMCLKCQHKQGLEIYALELIRKRLNFTVIYLDRNYSQWGLRSSNGSYDNVYGDIQNAEADLGIGMFHYEDFMEVVYFQMSFSYMEDSLKWIVPIAKPRQLENIVFIFTPTMLLATLAMLLINSLLMYIFAKLTNDTKRLQEFYYCFIVSYRHMIGIPVTVIPRKNIVRFIFINFCIAGTVITVVFQSRLTTALSTILYEEQITTAEDIIKAKLKYGYYSVIKDYFVNSNDTNLQTLSKNFIECGVGLSCISRVALNGDFATIKPKRLVEYALPFIQKKYGKHVNVYTFKSTLTHMHVYMCFAKGHPLFQRINDLLILMKQSGLISFYYQKLNEFNAWMSSKQPNLQSNTLDLYKLEAIFFIALIGYFVAFITFLIECIVFHLKIRNSSLQWQP